MHAHKPARSRPIAILLLLLLLLPALFGRAAAQGQGQSDLPTYWQYATSGRLLQLANTDIDLDGVEEFIIADENNHVDLVNAAGKQLWSYIAPDRITAVTAVPLLSDEGPAMGIALGLPNMIILLSAGGEEVWRAPVNPLDAPTSLRGSGSKAADSQLEGYEFLPVDIAPYDQNGDGLPEILALLQSGELLLFDQTGTQVWQYTDHPSEGVTATPRMLLSDLDQDGQEEIVLAVYDPRRFSQLILIDDGRALWELSLSRQITGLVEVAFADEGRPLIAIGTSLGHVYAYDYDRARHWLRTLNKPVTALAEIAQPTGSELAVGTAAGTVLSFDHEGRRRWITQLTDSPDEPVLHLAAAPPGLAGQQPTLAAIVDTDQSDANIAGAFLLSRDGQPLAKVNNVDNEDLTRIVDSNRDGNGELLIAHFATLELLGLGVGNSGNVQEWEYSLNAAPAAALVTDLDGNGSQEMIIGTKDGRVHNLNSDRSLRWLHNTGGSVSHLAVLPGLSGASGLVIAGLDEQTGGPNTAWLQVREADGERLWEQRLDAPLTAVLVADALPGEGVEIIAGSETGEILVFSAAGELLRRLSPVPGSAAIETLAFLPNGPDPGGDIAGAAGPTLFAVDLNDPVLPVRPLASFDNDVVALFPGATEGHAEIAVWLLAVTADGRLHGLNWRGIEMGQWGWPAALGGVPAAAAAFKGGALEGLTPHSTALLYGTETGQLAASTCRATGPC